MGESNVLGVVQHDCFWCLVLIDQTHQSSILHRCISMAAQSFSYIRFFPIISSRPFYFNWSCQPGIVKGSCILRCCIAPTTKLRTVNGLFCWRSICYKINVKRQLLSMVNILCTALQCEQFDAFVNEKLAQWKLRFKSATSGILLSFNSMRIRIGTAFDNVYFEETTFRVCQYSAVLGWVCLLWAVPNCFTVCVLVCVNWIDLRASDLEKLGLPSHNHPHTLDRRLWHTATKSSSADASPLDGGHKMCGKTLI